MWTPFVQTSAFIRCDSWLRVDTAQDGASPDTERGNDWLRPPPCLGPVLFMPPMGYFHPILCWTKRNDKSAGSSVVWPSQI